MALTADKSELKFYEIYDIRITVEQNNAIVV